jgi:phosphoglycerol transferase
VGLTYAALVVVMRLWHAHLRVPFEYRGDANFHGALFKHTAAHGWYETNANLGAPFGQHLHDFPLADNLHLWVVRVMALFTHDYAVLMNVYYLATFGLAAAAAVWAFRRLGLSGPVTVVLSVLFALQPYHFVRGESHLFLAAYFPVPLAVGLMIHAIRGEPVRLSPARAAGLVAICLLVGSTSSYYAAFTVILLSAATAMALVRRRHWRAALPGLAFVVLITGAQLANQLPDLLYARSHGANELVAHKSPEDTEVYSLKLAQMIMPIEGHRIGTLANARYRYAHTFPVPSEGRATAVGAVAALGLLWLLTVPLLSLVVGSDALDARHRELAGLALVGFLVATTGGLATLTSFNLTTQIRGWARMSIFLAFLALAAVGLLIDALARRAPQSGVQRRALGFVLLAVLLVAGLFDQTSVANVPDYAGVRAQFTSDAAFVSAIEARLPGRAMVFQLPFIPFPEAGPRLGMVDYDQLRGYLHSDRLRWSYAGVKGRPEADWQAAVADLPAAALAPTVAAEGFAGITVDRFGYSDGAGELEAGLTTILGRPPLVSGDKRLSFFDLTDYRRAMEAKARPEDIRALGDHTLLPTRVEFSSGFRAAEATATDTWRWTTRVAAEMTIVVPGTARRVVHLRMALAAAGPGWQAVVRLPDGSTRTLALSTEPVHLDADLSLSSGRHALRLTARPPGGDQGPGLILQVINAGVSDPELEVLRQRVTT